MSVRTNIINFINEGNTEADDFYYKANDIEKLLFELKKMSPNNDVEKRLEQMIIDLNSIRMESYNILKEVDNKISPMMDRT